MSAAGVRGLRATYHRVLDKVELLLPEKLRPLYNHPAGNEPSGSHRDLPSCPFPLFTNPLTTLPVDSSPTTPTPVPQVNLCTFPCSLFFTFSFPTCLKLVIFKTAPFATFVALLLLGTTQIRTRPLGLTLLHFCSQERVWGTRKPHSLPFPSMSSDILTHASKSCLTALECLE